MKKYAGRVLLFIGLAMAGGLMYHGALSRQKAAMLEQNAVLALDSPLNETITARMREAEEKQEEAVGFTAWAQEGNKSVKAEASGKTAEADILWINGSSHLLLPYGKILNQQDPEGCLLDERTASDLFGSIKVEGMRLLVDGQTWVIRGVFASPQKLLIVQDSREGDVAVWNRITVSLKQGQSVPAAEEDFLVRHGITGTPLRWDFYQNMSWLWELVPGKWSDFSGWSENIREKSQELKQLLQTEKSAIELEYLKLYRYGNWAILSGGLWAFAQLLLLFRQKHDSKKMCDKVTVKTEFSLYNK